MRGLLPELSMANAARGATGRYPHPLHHPRHPTCHLPPAAAEIWSWRRDLNPRPPDYKSGALPAELRQPDSSRNPGRREPPDRALTANGARQNARAQLSLYHIQPRRRRHAWAAGHGDARMDRGVRPAEGVGLRACARATGTAPIACDLSHTGVDGCRPRVNGRR